MEIRKLKASEVDQAIRLADRTFREEDHRSMGDAFPFVFSKNTIHSFGAFDDDKLVSFMGLVPSQIKVGESILDVFSIGAVCTDEAYRKRGISTAILKKVYHYIDQAKASLLFISGDRGLYTRNHCYHFGNTKRYTINKSDVNHPCNLGAVRPYRPADAFQVDHLRRKKEIRFESSLSDWAELLKSGGYTSITKMDQQCFVAESKDGIEAYVVIGLPNKKSTKEEALVIEWAGKPEYVHYILASIIKENIALVIEITIPLYDEINHQFSNYSSEKLGHSGTIYIVNVERLIEQIKPYIAKKDPELARSIAVKMIDDDAYKFTGKKIKLTCTREELTKIIFNADDKYQEGELETVFPLPLPNLDGMYYV